ncbi:hypothetical protein [Burkholderia ubonensis]|uniref:hypothetical protein n=1 Tax=Burkholderia ubonensis TaxID=101571 RepID=UPI000A8DE165|nr:hypothetical protein [Burkholderia ubonensis]
MVAENLLGEGGDPCTLRRAELVNLVDGDQAPVLVRLAGRPIMLVQPPHPLQPLALAYWGFDPAGFVTLRAPRMADALWAVEQALRAGTCAAVLLWQSAVRADALRRLNLAAQSGSALFFLFRPAAAAREASPGPLRLALAPRRDDSTSRS